MDITKTQLDHRFKFHPAVTQSRREAHETIREICRSAAEALAIATGSSSREQSLALTKLEEVMFWANAAVARGEGPASTGS